MKGRGNRTKADRGRSVTPVTAVTFFLMVVGFVMMCGEIYFVWLFRIKKKMETSRNIGESLRATEVEDISELNEYDASYFKNRTVVANILRKAGANVLDESKLPTLAQIADQYGKEPVILGLEMCEKFQQRVPAEGENKR